MENKRNREDYFLIERAPHWQIVVFFCHFIQEPHKNRIDLMRFRLSEKIKSCILVNAHGPLAQLVRASA